MTRPTAPYGFEFVRIAVPDLEEAKAFYEYHVGLSIVDDEADYATLRADVDHHCVELVADPGRDEMRVLALGFSARDSAALADLKRRVSGAGHEIRPVDDRLKPFVSDGFATSDPSGITLEIVNEFQVFAEPPYVEIRPLDIVHPFIATPRYDQSLAFYTEVLGFQPSDFIAHQTAFLRGENRFHHAIALRRAEAVEIAHVCFMMKSFDHVMRGFARARYKSVPTPSGLVNHSASRSIAFYMEVPSIGPPIELCDGHYVLTPEEHETHVPRRMSADPRNIDVWRVAADDWGLR